ncbi:MAG: hypothetical protein ACSW8G_01510 [Bacillota bacterium]
MKKTIAILLSLMTICMFSFAGCGNEEGSGAEMGQVDSNPDGTLMPFALSLGINDDGTVNFTEMDDSVTCQQWNAESEAFEDADYSNDTIRGNFVRLIDEDGNKKADKAEVVAFADAEGYWDNDMAWAEGVAAETEPSVDDEEGLEVYGDESTIPYGERLLGGFGLSDYCGTDDFQNDENITYWTDTDWYNVKSGGTLTILPEYGTYLQPNGWSCGCCSALCALDWYGMRNGLNDVDLGMLRETCQLEVGTDVEYLQNAFENLAELGLTPKWTFTSSADDPEKLFDSEWVQNELKAGHPIMVEWNPFGWHWQTIIGYDNMGTEDTLDDVCIVMDSYDTTDQDNNGYYIESYERLIYGVCTSYYDPEKGFAEEGTVTPTQFLVAVPDGWEYTMEEGDGIAPDEENVGVFTDENKMPYGKTAEDIQKYYKAATEMSPDEEGCLPIGDNGLGGAAEAGYERSGDHDNSPYYKFIDCYNLEDTDTLHVLTNFQTLQQSSEYSCGATSAAMVTNWFGKNEGETDMSLMHARQDGELGGTFLDGMEQIFQYMNDTYDQDWVWVDTKNLDDPDGEESYIGDYCLQAGTMEGWYGLIPYLLDNDIPVMIGWDEWGGHWQVVIGYDDMGTVEKTEDDVLILADPYDTTDHNQDGYLIEGFERLVYGYYSSFEETYKHNDFIAAFPAEGHEDVIEALGIEQ